MARRVVITGLGLVSAVGVGTEESWQAVLDGRSGIAPITRFDTNGFACTIAAEVKGFDPLQFVAKKELKKMGLFIQYALAAAEFAMKQADLRATSETAERIGVFLGSGIGGFDVIEREHTANPQRWTAQGISLLYSGLDRESGGGARVDPPWREGTELGALHGLLVERPRRGRRLQGYCPLRCRSDDLRRLRGRHHPHGRWRLRIDARAFHAQ